MSVWGSQAERLERFRSELRASLGAADFDASEAAGAELSYDEALAESDLAD